MAIVTKALSGYNIGGFIGDAVNVGFTLNQYGDERNNGASPAVALAKSAGSFLAGEVYWSSMNKYVGGAAAKGVTRALTSFGVKQGVASAVGTVASFGTTIGVMAAQAGVQLLGAKMENTTKIMSQAYGQRGKFGSGYFNMTDAGYTMRQRSLNAIRSNGLNTQSVLGNEARTYYRGVV